ncbi:Indoleamine 2,3-dioxygenase [Marasmius fiardii PR-910]|nr:Indoleamine 2,3-dioxygenase [Marasmius fiardii PR-910]
MQPGLENLTESVFDVDSKTGFMPPRPPLDRLPSSWTPWESLLDSAIREKLRPGDVIGLSPQDEARSTRWRGQVDMTPVLSLDALKQSPVLLRRAHLVLTFLLHFYVQTIPPTAPVLIPRAISIPLLKISNHLGISPVVTFSDTVLYNWNLKTPLSPSDFPPSPDNLRSQTLFSGLLDEEAFYLSSARIELRGVEALEIMRMTMDEIFVGDHLAVGRVTKALSRLAIVIRDLRQLLLDVRKGCDPEVYYNEVRPWFRGEDSDPFKRKWVFEGISEEGLEEPKELSGASAGQSSLVHALDCFLCVDNVRATSEGKPSFMSRMQVYMPRNHRLFLDHLAKTSRPLRGFVQESNNEGLLKAFNEAVMALKEFRDAHMIIVTLYIIGPARRAKTFESEKKREEGLKGTGGTNLVKFLKDTRSQTAETILETPFTN